MLLTYLERLFAQRSAASAVDQTVAEYDQSGVQAPAAIDQPIALDRAVTAPDFPERLDALVRSRQGEGQKLSAGSFEIVGLDDIKEALAERWDAVSARVGLLAQREISERLGESDLLEARSDVEFAIYFGRLGGAAAEERARRIAKEVKQALLAALPEFSSALSVKQYVAEIDVGDIDGPPGSLADRLIGTIRRLRLEADRAILNYRRLLLKDFQVMFAPVWEPTRQMVEINRCVLDLAMGCTTLSQFQAIADPEQMADTLADLDCLVLTRALESLHRAGRSALGAHILVPVGFPTLFRVSSQRNYLKLIDTIPEVYRPFLKLEITTVPANANPGAVMGVLDALGDRAQVVIQLNGNPAVFDALDATRLWGISWNFSGWDGRDPERRNRMADLVERADIKALKTFAHGINSIGLAMAAIDAGFDYVNGTAIHLSQDQPRLPCRLHPLTFPRQARAAGTRMGQ
jgi:hypothetical protein